MPRPIVLGNGKTLVGLDRFGQVRDLYYPRVGLEDQVRGHYIHKLGVFVDGAVSWFDEDKNWQINVEMEDESLSSKITAINETLGLRLIFKDLVYNEEPIFIRRIEITNLERRSREIKFFIGHQFELFKSHSADTAYFDPTRHAIIHYKGQRVFLMNGEIEDLPFSDYTIGLANYQGMEGSHRDADDGALSKNPIEHGPADSVMGFYGFYSGGETKIIHYWMTMARSIPAAISLNNLVLKRTPEHMLKTTSDYWRAWVNKYSWSFYKLSPEAVSVFKKSLMIIRAHTDDGGAIIASGDSDMLQQGKDTYSYMWPRDASFSARALDLAGDQNVAKRFFQFCKGVISEDGYFMHKYLPDGSLGSSWHPWIRDGIPQLPIQEDETALVVWALYEHYIHSKDLEFVEELFNPVIEKAADFMVSYREKSTGLPKGSYDLWEEKYGTSTFSSAAVYGALMAAANFSKLLGKVNHAENYSKAANEIKEGIMKYLYDESSGNFAKLIRGKAKALTFDRTIDISSAFGVFYFSVLPPNDPKLARAFKQSIEVLSRNNINSIARYEGDNYYRVPGESIGNPWVITTLWGVQYDIARAQTEKEFQNIRDRLDMIAKQAHSSGALSEQMNPFSGEQVSATPLTWSHAEFVISVIKYLDRSEDLGLCLACNPVP